MHKLARQAFTLIELLVVIAIIGILSGLIVVSMSGITQKASIAKAQVFSNSLRNALMMNIIGEWKFDGITADESPATNSDVLDTWNGINNGDVGAHQPTVKTGSNCVSGSCLSFDGVNDYISVGNNIPLSIKTFDIWLKVPAPTDSGEHRLFNFGGSGFHNEFTISTGTSHNSILFLHNTNYRYWNTPLYLDNKWHLWTLQITGVTASDISNASLYIDGKLISPGTTAPSSTPIAWGNFWFGYSNTATINGLIDEVRIYNAIIPISQIKEQYYSGLNSLLANGNINNKEYIERISNLLASK